MLASELRQMGESLRAFPLRGRAGAEPGTRELPLGRPYVIVYEVTDAEVIVLRVWHAAESGRLRR